MTPCERIRDQLPELIRDGDDALSGELRAHLTACEACRELRQGAVGLGAELGAWTLPAPPVDLVERTLASLALRAQDDAGEASPAAQEPPPPIPFAQVRRRSSVEILTSPLGGMALSPATPPSRRQLLRQVLLQSAAAVVLFGISCVFVAAYYPVVVQAYGDRQHERCRERLARLGAAVQRYLREHPDADPERLRGSALRAALVEGGYADVEDFRCPAQSTPLGYNGWLPRGEGNPVVFMDQLGNHPDGLNVVYASGRTELVSLEALHRRLEGELGEGE